MTGREFGVVPEKCFPRGFPYGEGNNALARHLDFLGRQATSFLLASSGRGNVQTVQPFRSCQ